jgi:hypothetical protein
MGEMSEKISNILQPAALTAEPRPLLSQLKGLNLEDLVPQKLIRKHLMELDEASTDEDIRDARSASAALAPGATALLFALFQ